MKNDKTDTNNYEAIPSESATDLEAAHVTTPLPHVTTSPRDSDFGYYSPRYTAVLALRTSVYITCALVIVDYIIYTKFNDDNDYPLQNPNFLTVLMRWVNVYVGQFFAMRSFVLLRSQSREGHSYFVICLFALAGLVFTMAAFLVQFQQLTEQH